jgi:hypothetical protein
MLAVCASRYCSPKAALHRAASLCSLTPRWTSKPAPAKLRPPLLNAGVSKDSVSRYERVWVFPFCGCSPMIAIAIGPRFSLGRVYITANAFTPPSLPCWLFLNDPLSRACGVFRFHNRALPSGRFAHPFRQQSCQPGCLAPLPSGQSQNLLSFLSHPSSRGERDFPSKNKRRTKTWKQTNPRKAARNGLIKS